MISLQTRELPLSPLAISIDTTEAPWGHLLLNGEGSFSEGDLTIGELFLCSGKMTVWQSHLSVKQRATGLEQTIDRVLCRHPERGTLGTLLVRQGEAPGDLLTRTFGRILEDAARQFRSGDAEQAAVTLSGLVGLGLGLTPSGDDFLCGLLSVLPEGSLRESLIRQCMPQLHTTTDISAAFLEAACQGCFGEWLHELYGAQTPDAAEDAAERIAAIGHSSGCDLLAGVAYGLKF